MKRMYIILLAVIMMFTFTSCNYSETANKDGFEILYGNYLMF